MIRNTIGMSALLLMSAGCEAFKGQTSIIDTAAVGPTPVEPGDEPSGEPSGEPGDEPSNEPSSDTDTEDTVDPNELDCKDDPVVTNELPELQCVSARLFDGDQIDATTSGAVNYFSKDHYNTREWGCDASFDGQYDSPEHAFIFVHPAQGFCNVELETRCGDFDLLAFPYNVEADGCPIAGDPLPQEYSCEMSSKRGTGRTESLTLYENSPEEKLYLIIVDAPTPTEEWFRLTVDCD